MRALLPSLSALTGAGLLAACGGGGSGGGSGSVSPAEPVPPTNPMPSAAESGANYGIAQIGARAAYSAGARGQKVTIALVDSGIDVDHPEFAGRIDPDSIDIVLDRKDTIDDRSGHGTHVIGIAAAAADGKGMHGVAPRANILAIRTDLRDKSICSEPGCGYFDSDVAKAINYAIDHGAKVVNLSLGKDTPINGAYRSALERAAARDVLVVNAAGNYAVSPPLQPGALATEKGIEGHLLIVGAVGADNQLWRDSNRPGASPLKEKFLVAPGVRVFSTAPGGGYTRLTGTSMATPHVTGAAALLKSRFPSLSMREIGDILLASAVDLGPAGADATYGRGLVSVERALQPSGRLSLPEGATVAEGGAAMDRAGVSLGAAFGDAMEGRDALDGVLALDAYGRPYAIDLGANVRRRDAGFDWENALVERTTAQSFDTAIGETGWTARSRFEGDRDRPLDHSLAARLGDADALEATRLSFTSDAALPQRITIGTGLDQIATAGPGRLRGEEAGLFLNAQRTLLSDRVGVERGLGFGYAFDVARGTTFEVGALADEDDTDTRMLGARLIQRLGTVELSLGLGRLDESDGQLGSESSGVLSLAPGARSRFVELGARWNATGDTALFAQAMVGETEMDGEGALFRDWSTVRSSAVAVGASTRDLVHEGDRWGLMLSQPLRVDRASSRLDVPVSRDLEGNIQRRSERLDLAPRGREIDLQLAYARPLDADWHMASWLLLQHEAGHDAERGLDTGIGLRLTRTFDTPR
ncbi:MAG: S8 family serine peptidase [Geminicoccaceae bacterium]|nr:S8 family serine peptidase [Geminicoccaceae bacterium]